MFNEMDKAVEKLENLGVTVKVNTHDGQEPAEGTAAHAIKTAAQKHGIYEEPKNV